MLLLQSLRNRTIRHNHELSILLDNPTVEPTNNRAERQLRLMLIMKKLVPAHAGVGNRSDSGASDQVVAKSIVETGILNGVEPLEVLTGYAFP